MLLCSGVRKGAALAIFFLCSAFLPGFLETAFGQAQNSGTVAGSVIDPQHNIIPAAKLTLTSEERGNSYTATSNSNGEYTFNDVQVGTYTLTATAPSFSTYVSRHIIVDSDTHLRIDAALKPGNVDVQVEVTADPVAVDTQSATIGAVIDNVLVENLPIDGNNVVALASILPGVTDVVAPTTFTDENGGATFYANGARNNSNLFLFDGLLWNNLFLNTGINYPNHAVLHQVSVQLNSYSAQYGRSAGSIFNVVSKSGTNSIHGEFFLHYQDSMFNAQDYFSHVKPPQHTYQFGLAVGGPIKHDKLFYEAEFQALTGFTTVLASAETLTNAERGLLDDGVTPRPCSADGFFPGQHQCASFAGDARDPSLVNSVLFNPLATSSSSSFGSHPTTALTQLQSTWIHQGGTGTNPCIDLLNSVVTKTSPASGSTPATSAGWIKNAEVPSICFDPVVQNLIQGGYIPVPDTYKGNSQFPYASPQPRKPQSEYGGFLRGDWNLRPNQIVDARFYRTDNADHSANGSSSLDTGVPTYAIDANSARVTAGSIGETWVMNANLVNVARLGYKRYEYLVLPLDRTTLGSLGSNFSYPGFPSLPYLQINTRFNLGSSQSAFTHSVNQNIEFIDNVSWVHGPHNFQFGVDYLRMQYYNQRANAGHFNFYGNPGYTNLQSADFIMGLIYSEQIGNQSTIAANSNPVYTYAQDTWRILPRLTLSLGVRYELPFQWYQPKGQAATFVRGFQSTIFPNAPAGTAFVGDPGIPRSLVKTDYSNISPRVGAAYTLGPNGRTAIRASFGTFYDAIPATIVGYTQPFVYSANYQQPDGSLSDPLLNKPAIPADFNPGTATFTTPYSITYPDPNFRTAYILAFNLGFQHQLNKGTILEVNYIGRLARHLTMALDQNEAIVDCSGAYYQANPDLYCHQPFSSMLTTSGTYGYPNRVRYPGYNYGGQGVVDIQSSANANYHAGQVIYRQRAFRNLSVMANYTYSRTMDLQSSLSISNSTPTPSTPWLQYGPSDQNTKHIFNMGWRLELPRIRSGNSFVKQLVNNWQINGTYNARTGHPVNLTFGGDESGNDEPSQRPNLNPGYKATLPSNRHRVDKIHSWFNNDPLAFSKPAAGTIGNVRRNSIVGPAYICTNLSVTKDITLNRIRSGTRAQFRVEGFNIFNTVNLGQPRANYSSSSGQASTFGSINSSGSNPNRRIQFGFIMYF